MSLRMLSELWNKFWFEPTSPTPIALFRIIFGLIILQCLLVHILPWYLFYYGENGILPIGDVQGYWWKAQAEFDAMMLLPPGDMWRWIFFDVTVAATISMTLGLFTRISTITIFISILSMHRHFPFNTNGGDNFLRLAAFIMCFSNAGQAISLDNLLRALKEDWRQTGFAPRRSPPWAQRLLQVQTSISYLYTFFAKFSSEKWIKGIACYYSLRLEDLERFPLPKFIDNPLVMKFLTWSTMAIEFSLGTLIWIKEFRYWVILTGLVFHMCIEWTLNLPMFEWIFMATYILFVPSEDLTKAMDFVKGLISKWRGASSMVAYDGNCLFCVRTVGLIHRLDIFDRLRLVDFRSTSLQNFDYARAEKEMLVQTKFRVSGGFEGFREVAKRLPLIWIFLPILYLPGASIIGKLIYDYIAAHRYLILGGRCTGDVCT